jgi:hypothetical protein
VKTFTVYLAGPVTGLTYDGAEDWRAFAAGKLFARGVHAISPLRGQEYLRSIGEISPTGEGYATMHPLSSPRAIASQNRFDATRCGLMLVNFLGAQRVSIGTVMEIAWADLKRIPVVVAMEPEGNPHEHILINDAITHRTTTLEQAIDLAIVIGGHSVAPR